MARIHCLKGQALPILIPSNLKHGVLGKLCCVVDARGGHGGLFPFPAPPLPLFLPLTLTSATSSSSLPGRLDSTGRNVLKLRTVVAAC